MAGYPKAIVLNVKDNVATAIADIQKGAVVTVEVHGRPEAFTLPSSIPSGHKFALYDLKEGEAVIKYGESIGRATGDILRGEHVHVHNVISRSGGKP